MRRPVSSSSDAGPVIEQYLAEFSARLPGSRRALSGIVAELRSGLLDAKDARQSAGLPPAEAAEAAIREFGDPVELAGAFRAEVAASQARYFAVALLATGPMVGLLWILTAVASHLDQFWQWSGMPPGLRVEIPLVALSVGITGWAAMLSIATTGRLTRWLPAKPRRAPTAAAVAAFGALGADGLGLLLLAVQLVTGLERLSPIPATVAAAASVARLLLAKRAAGHCLAIRTSLA